MTSRSSSFVRALQSAALTCPRRAGIFLWSRFGLGLDGREESLQLEKLGKKLSRKFSRKL